MHDSEILQYPLEPAASQQEFVYDLDAMSGHDFEAAMIHVFEKMGYKTHRGKLANDEGRDIVLTKNGRVVVVECKHQKASVGRPVVQKLHSAALTYPLSLIHI